MDRKRYSSVHCVIVLLCLAQGLSGHLLPSALEDVHAFVQSELHRSQGKVSGMAVEVPSQAGPILHSTQTFLGTPITIQNEVRFNRNGGLDGISGDLSTAQSQNSFAQVDNLPRGLIPPVPLEHPKPPQAQSPPQQQTSASDERPSVIQANVVGPSTFISDVPRNPMPAISQQLPVQQVQQHVQQHVQQLERGKTMEGWHPIDNEGSTLAKGVGVKLQVTEDLKPQKKTHQDVSYRGVAYTVRNQKPQAKQQESNGIEIVQTNAVRLEEITAAPKKVELKERKPPAPTRYPVYPRNINPPSDQGSPKVVIHAQNVIIRGNEDEASPLDITAIPNNGSSNVQAVPAYSGVFQLNNFLRDQLRFAAMNQILHSQVPVVEHPLAGQQFPRPLSLREIAQAVRNGEFPTEPTNDQVLGQPSLIAPTQIQFNIPHVVKMDPNQAVPDALPLASIDAQPKVVLPGVGLGNLYRNILQQEASLQGQGGFDPRTSIEYSLLATLSGQRLKPPAEVPKFKSNPHTMSDYGDKVAYTGTKAKDQNQKGKLTNKDEIQILSAVPMRAPPMRNAAAPQTPPQNPGSTNGGGSLRQMQDHLLKQLLLQELQEEVEEDKFRRPPPPQEHQTQLLLPVGLQLQRPATVLKPTGIRHHVPYGTNAHPFAYLAEEGNPPSSGPEEHVFEETFEYTLPPGASLEDFLHDDGHHTVGLKKRPRGPIRHIHSSYPSSSYGGAEHDHHHDHEHEHAHEHGHGSGPGSDLMPLNKDTLMQFGKGLLNSALEFSRHHNPLTVLSRIRSLPPVKVDLYKVPMGIPDDLIHKIPEKWKSGSGSPYGGGRGKRKHLPRKNNPKFY